MSQGRSLKGLQKAVRKILLADLEDADGNVDEEEVQKAVYNQVVRGEVCLAVSVLFHG